MITHLEPDILECEIKWALESITINKPSGGDGIPVELFQILKVAAVKVLHSICHTNLESSAVATGLEKVSFHSNPKERQCRRMLNTISHQRNTVSHSEGESATRLNSYNWKGQQCELLARM